MTLLLGVDGGGTKTAARVLSTGPDGRLCLLASGFAGGSNPYSVGWDTAEAAVAAAVTQALALLEEKPSSAVIAIAGCASEEARARLSRWAQKQSYAGVTSVVPDTQPILADLPDNSAAIGLIAGTGSSVLARHESGTTEVVGGWGYLIDDGGSGYALGRDALRRVTEQADAGEPLDAFAEAILKRAGVERVVEIKARLYGSSDPRGWIASLAPTVLSLAESGDSSAAKIAAAGWDHLALAACHAADRLENGTAKPSIRLAGGLLIGSSYYRHGLKERLAEAGWEAGRIGIAPDGAIGCALLARRNGS